MRRSTNPIPQIVIPKHHEGSYMRSPRDSDDANKNWLKATTTNSQLASLVQNVEQIQRQLDRLRFRSGADTDGGEEVEVTLCDKYTGEQVVYLLRGRLKPEA